MDGLGTPDEYAQKWYKHGDYLCISDHGMMGAVPAQIRACDEVYEEHGKKLHPIFAIELYLNPLHTEPTPTKEIRDKFLKNFDKSQEKKFQTSYHLLAIAYNNEGYKNLVRLNSWAYQNGFYRKPRVNRELLAAHKEGIIFSSCCYASEIGKAFDLEGPEAAEEMVCKYMALFGTNFYLEIMLLDFNKQKPYDIFILKMKDKYKLPVILTNDVHYCNEEDSHYQRLMLMIQTKRTLAQMNQAIADNDGSDFFELQDKNLWMKTEEEINHMWSTKYSDAIDLDLFKEAKRTTVEVCKKAKGVELDRKIKFPTLPDEEGLLKEEIVKGVKFRNITNTMRKQSGYDKRIQEEYDLICRKGFCSYYLLCKKIVDEARRVSPIILGWGDGREAVGPGRGSGAGSLVLYLLGVTDVDPIREGLLFSRFLSDARGGKQLKLKFSEENLKNAKKRLI